MKLEDLTDPDAVPPFDHGIQWRRYLDRPPRRRVGKQAAEPTSKEVIATEPANNLRRNIGYIGKQIRQMSMNSDDELPSKRRKDYGSMNSCRSNDLNAAIEMEEEVEEDDFNRTQ